MIGRASEHRGAPLPWRGAPRAGSLRGPAWAARLTTWLAVLALALVKGSAGALDLGAIETARLLLATYHQDPANLEQARDVLTAAVQRDEPPAALILLARTWFLIGEIHARTDAERLAAYEQGRDAGRRAVAAAPQRADAHLWYAINLGRWAEARGVLRAAMALSAVKEEVDLVLRLDPRSVEGHALAGSLAAELPGFLGGSLRRAEEEFRRALELDPRRASVRVELAGLYVETKRYADARRELRRALEEPAPSDLPYWTIRMLPRAQSLLESIRDK
jgi:tetratricopeptide (TPR) repeat protein